MQTNNLLKYTLGNGVEAFSTRRDSILPYKVILGHQVHESKVAIVDKANMSEDDLDGYDAFVTNLIDVAIGVKTADCVPVLMYDPVQRVVAAVHAGWKGTAKHISQKAIHIMFGKYGTKASDIKAVIGPAIGPDSFQVGEEVAYIFKEAGFPLDEIWSFRGQGDGSAMSGGHHIDLFKANVWLLEQSGVLPENIQVTGIDTYTDCSFFSARRETVHCGRIISSIKLQREAQTEPL